MDQYVSIETYKQVCMERDIAIEQLRQLGYEFGENTRRKIKNEDRIPDEMAIKILDNISYVLDDGSKVKKAYNQGIEALQERIEREREDDELDFIQKHPSVPVKISIPSNDEISASLVGFCKGIIATEESEEKKND